MVNTSWKAGERMKIYCDTCDGRGFIYHDYNDSYEKCENCKGKGYNEPEVKAAGLNENKLIEVCSACKRACCWYGEFMCDNNKDASTELKTVKELRELKARAYDANRKRKGDY